MKSNNTRFIKINDLLMRKKSFDYYFLNLKINSKPGF